MFGVNLSNQHLVSRPSDLLEAGRRAVWMAVVLIGGVAVTAGGAGFLRVAHAQMNEPIRPIPLESKLDAAKVALGDKLFHDKRLSKDNSVSCASCHALGKICITPAAA